MRTLMGEVENQETMVAKDKERVSQKDVWVVVSSMTGRKVE